MKYTSHQHRPGVVKVETKDGVICDTINDLPTADLIADALNAYQPLLDLRGAADDLNSIVDGPFNVRWTHNGVRLTDTPQWCAFFVALAKVQPISRFH